MKRTEQELKDLALTRWCLLAMLSIALNILIGLSFLAASSDALCGRRELVGECARQWLSVLAPIIAIPIAIASAWYAGQFAIKQWREIRIQTLLSSFDHVSTRAEETISVRFSVVSARRRISRIVRSIRLYRKDSFKYRDLPEENYFELSSTSVSSIAHILEFLEEAHVQAMGQIEPHRRNAWQKLQRVKGLADFGRQDHKIIDVEEIGFDISELSKLLVSIASDLNEIDEVLLRSEESLKSEAARIDAEAFAQRRAV